MQPDDLSPIVEPTVALQLGADSAAAAMTKAANVAAVAVAADLLSLAVELVPAAVVLRVVLSTKPLDVAPKENK